MPGPLASILITTYNEEDYITGAVRSALKQTYDNIEVVIVDDGSTDSTVEVIQREFRDERLKLFCLERKGRVRSLNFGTNAADGEFIAILDADDRCKPERIEKQVSYLMSHGEVGVVGSYCDRIDKVRKERHIRCYPSRDKDIRKEMSKYIPIPHSSATFRKSCVVEAGGYDESLSDHEDLDLWIRVAQDWKLANIPEPLVARQIRNESYWHSNFSPHARNIHLAKLNARAITELCLPWYYYVFPVVRVLYTSLPTQLKRLARRLLSETEEENATDRNEDAENLPF